MNRYTTAYFANAFDGGVATADRCILLYLDFDELDNTMSE